MFKNNQIITYKILAHQLQNLLNSQIFNHRNFNILFTLIIEENKDLKQWIDPRNEFLSGFEKIYKEQIDLNGDSLNFFWLMEVNEKGSRHCSIFFEIKRKELIKNIKKPKFLKKVLNLWFNICLKYNYISSDSLNSFKNEKFKDFIIIDERLLVAYFLKNIRNYVIIFDVTVTVLFDYLLKTSWAYDKIDSSIIWVDDYYLGYSNGLKNEIENFKLKELDYNNLNPNDLFYNNIPPSYLSEGFISRFKKELKVDFKKPYLKILNLK